MGGLFLQQLRCARTTQTTQEVPLVVDPCLCLVAGGLKSTDSATTWGKGNCDPEPKIPLHSSHILPPSWRSAIGDGSRSGSYRSCYLGSPYFLPWSFIFPFITLLFLFSLPPIPLCPSGNSQCIPDGNMHTEGACVGPGPLRRQDQMHKRFIEGKWGKS